MTEPGLIRDICTAWCPGRLRQREKPLLKVGWVLGEAVPSWHSEDARAPPGCCGDRTRAWAGGTGGLGGGKGGTGSREEPLQRRREPVTGGCHCRTRSGPGLAGSGSDGAGAARGCQGRGAPRCPSELRHRGHWGTTSPSVSGQICRL